MIEGIHYLRDLNWWGMIPVSLLKSFLLSSFLCNQLWTEWSPRLQNRRSLFWNERGERFILLVSLLLSNLSKNILVTFECIVVKLEIRRFGEGLAVVSSIL
jgi:hypothetical protein